MISRIAFLVLSFTALSHHVAHPTHLQMVQWTKVAICEEGGNWKLRGSLYSGALGRTNANWSHYGGTRYASNAGLAAPWQQVMVAMRINRGYPVPDQHGCTGSW
jgi:hypothetical protein